VRGRLPRSVIVTFWHIPWPEWQALEVCPWQADLVNGLLGGDIVGFQTSRDGSNFMDAAEHVLGAEVDRERRTIAYAGHRVSVREYPVSIEWPHPLVSRCAPIDVCRRQVRELLGLEPDIRLGIGLDRLDYTKGLEEKFSAIERLFERHPEFIGSFAFVQLAQPTRGRLPVYQELRSRLRAAVERINRRFGAPGRRPVTVVEGDHSPEDVFRYLRAADLCHVASLHDGMNLLSKEFVCARDDDQGVLILSRFAGAALQLTGALLVNPLDSDAMVDTLALALRMDGSEQRRRMQTMRAAVARNDAFRWGERMLNDAARVRSGSRDVEIVRRSFGRATA
jgi:trehalose 6-phosphate synthase